MEDEYQLEYFKSEGLTRNICTSCGKAFWTRILIGRYVGMLPVNHTSL